jgi:hypothetical protein
MRTEYSVSSWCISVHRHHLHLCFLWAFTAHWAPISRFSRSLYIRERCGSVHLQGTDWIPGRRAAVFWTCLQGRKKKKRKHGIWGWTHTRACGSMYNTGATLRSGFISQVSSSFALLSLCSEDPWLDLGHRVPGDVFLSRDQLGMSGLIQFLGLNLHWFMVWWFVR